MQWHPSILQNETIIIHNYPILFVLNINIIIKCKGGGQTSCNPYIYIYLFTNMGLTFASKTVVTSQEDVSSNYKYM